MNIEDFTYTEYIDKDRYLFDDIRANFPNEYHRYFDKINMAIEKNYNKVLDRYFNEDEAKFLKDIHSYDNLSWFKSSQIQSYKQSIGRNFLYSLPHIPSNFTFELYEDNQNLFGDLLYSQIDDVVEEKFLQLNARFFKEFEKLNDESYNSIKVFSPETFKELLAISEKFSFDIIDMECAIKDSHRYEMEDKIDFFNEYFIAEITDGIVTNKYSAQAYDDKTAILDEPILLEFAEKFKERLINEFGYEAVILKDLNDSDRYDTYCALVFGNNEESMEEAIDYLLTKYPNGYEILGNRKLELEDNEDSKSHIRRRR